MKKLITVLFSLVVLSISVKAQGVVQISNSVYGKIMTEPDTSANNIARMELFDQKMRSIDSNTVILLDTGTFLTRGSVAGGGANNVNALWVGWGPPPGSPGAIYKYAGFKMKTGWKISGAGWGDSGTPATIVKLNDCWILKYSKPDGTPYTSDGTPTGSLVYGGGNCVFETQYAFSGPIVSSTSHVSISNLVIDLNFDNLKERIDVNCTDVPKPKKGRLLTLNAINIVGVLDNHVDHVKVIHAASNFLWGTALKTDSNKLDHSNVHEGFIIWNRNFTPDSPVNADSSVSTTNCLVTDFPADYGYASAICMTGCNNGLMKNNTVNFGSACPGCLGFAFNPTSSNKMKIIGNTSYFAHNGLNCDVYTVHDAYISNNNLYNCYNIGMRFANTEQSGIIQNNFISMYGNKNYAGIYEGFWNSHNAFTISANTITATNNSGYGIFLVTNKSTINGNVLKLVAPNDTTYKSLGSLRNNIPPGNRAKGNQYNGLPGASLCNTANGFVLCDCNAPYGDGSDLWIEQVGMYDADGNPINQWSSFAPFDTINGNPFAHGEGSPTNPNYAYSDYTTKALSGTNSANQEATLPQTNFRGNFSYVGPGPGLKKLYIVPGFNSIKYPISGTVPLHYSAWIDFNRDEIFDTISELIVDSTVVTSPFVVLYSDFSIPQTAINGATRMRVKLSVDANSLWPTPCEQGFIGETEDHTINIYGATDASVFNAFTGVRETKARNEKTLTVKIYPNPSTGNITVELGSDYVKSNTSIVVYSMLGELVSTITGNNINTVNSFNLCDLPRGTYIVRVYSNNSVVNKKIVLVAE